MTSRGETEENARRNRYGSRELRMCQLGERSKATRPHALEKISTSIRLVIQANTTPRIPPKTDSNVLSVRNWRTILARPAPIARRTAFGAVSSRERKPSKGEK
jgi:hypothetical protein